MAGGKKGKGGQGGGKKPEQNEGQFKFNFDSEGQQLVPKEAKTATLDLANNQAFVNLIQQRMGSLIGKSSGYFESLPPKVQERVKALKNLHSQKVELDKAFKKEFKALQDKYEAMFAPLYVRRSELVQGKSEPKPEELVEAKKEEKDEKAEAKEEKKEAKSEEQGGKAEEKDVKGIPDFWLEALKHNDDFGEMITKKDEQVLKHLIDVRWKPAEGHPDPSFVVEFEFEENEWFTNKVVSKTYILSENESIGETMFDNVESTPINWKPGKNITVKLVQQQIGRGGRRGKGRGGKPQTKMVEQKQHSFFNFFDKEGLIPANEDMDEDDDYNEADLLEFDYELGLALKEQIIPSAVVWFTGEANQGFGMEGEEFGEDFDDESGEDEEFEPPKQLTGAPGEQKPECAQQ